MTKASTEAQANIKAQSDALTKQLSTLQENLKKINESNSEQVKKFNSTITEMQKTNSALQDSVGKLTQQNATAAANLQTARAQVDELTQRLKDSSNGRLFLISIAVVAIIAALVLALAECANIAFAKVLYLCNVFKMCVCYGD